MKLSNKIALLITVSTLFFVSRAFAIPMAGETVFMEDDWTVPYTMTDEHGHEYQSFCLESKVYFTPNRSYDVQSVGNYAYGGGGGATNGGDEVNDDSKWLYAAFVSNIFSSVTGAAQEVQKAIWWHEGEIGGSIDSWTTLNTFKFDDSGWNVFAVNITKNGRDKQSQLIGTAPVPEPATMLLFGTGLFGLAGMKLRRKK